MTSQERPEQVDQFELPTITHLVHLHHDALYRYAFRLTGSAPDAEDLLQQTFLSAHRNLEQLRNVSHAKAWLYTILRNAYLKQLRHRDRYHVELAEELDVPQQEPQQSWFDEERLQSAVRCLPEANRVVVMMFYFEELSYREIADQLGIALGTVMSRLSRGKALLRRELAEPPGSAPNRGPSTKQGSQS
ncbi:MAG: RNA polymerase sigma factor [Pirellulaceae bacterium]|nr:RNA polymerase sigma factor [Planctomycetales bacterium]